ncbi:MAG: Asp-tRNA(Asn)/Glu-tRNA(Gln) amidotransferase subunit GatB [Spirochaetia bacterium]|nr:Asp-tRNA(Asn)/Glu-tRNA(Gln) amidotransferase subunit GatB [Spirochaetia bacterium]
MSSIESEYRTFIGIEIHIQLLTNTKVFCECPVGFGDEPNTNVCPICLGYPGVLPALNEEALFKAYQVATALNCRLSPSTVFERKNYFYPDMPKNYQISQYQHPIGMDGRIEFPYRDEVRSVRIHDVHLEEDAGKMIHAGDISLIDYNRAGTPLLEIVTEPDLTSGDETEAFIQYFRRFVRYLEVCDGNMEEGSLRCDANISLNHPGHGLGTKVEVKNLNSSRFVRLALNHERQRQEKLLTEGSRIQQETRLWNENRDITVVMRRKEESHDYRYFPEPDLPPFCPTPDYLEAVHKKNVELPLQRMKRFKTEFDLEGEALSFLTEEKSRAVFFEETLALIPKQKSSAENGAAGEVYRWLSGDVLRHLNRSHLGLEASFLTPMRLAELINLIDSGRIHGKIAKQILHAVFEEDKDPTLLLEEKGLEQITNPLEIRSLVQMVIAQNPAAAAQAAAQVTAGENKVLGFFMGLVMKASSGRSDPQLTQSILLEEFSKRSK